MHSKAHALATLLSETSNNWNDMARAIEQLFDDYSDEQKADLYALLADTVTEGMTFDRRTHVVNGCLLKNERYFTRG